MNEFDWNEFNPNTVETPNRDPLPAGEYTATVTASEMKDNRAATGKYLALTFQVVDGPHTGAFVWANMNLVNPSEQAVQIARAELAALCKSIGVLQPRDSTDLHDKPVIIRVVVRKDDNGNPRNEIKAYKPVGTAPAAATTAKPAAKAASVPPWKKK
jgi:hypothetical protein